MANALPNVVGTSFFCNKMEEAGVNSEWLPDT